VVLLGEQFCSSYSEFLLMKKHVFIFPGQGSQKIGMLAELAAVYREVKYTYEQASDVLHYDLWRLCQHGEPAQLGQTEITQPALLAAGVAIWRIWQQQGGNMPVMLAGHSFGEYTALVCAGALDYTDTVLLAQYRGRFMQQAVAEGVGAMAAIMGLEDEQVILACQQAIQHDEIVSAANFNAPGQVVISGHKQAVQQAIINAKKLGAKRAMLLDVSVPAHCALMQSAADLMSAKLAQVEIKTPQIPVIHNVDVTSKHDANDIRQILVAQLSSPVQWVNSVRKLTTVASLALSAGQGNVLVGLNKRIAPTQTALALDNPSALEQALALVLENVE
jgi:[acyl-carrier-protein] S-malonyltransferase